MDLFPRAWCGCLNHEGETGQSRFYDGGGGGGGGGGEDGGTSATWNRRQRENGGGRKKFDERRFVLCMLGMDDRKVLKLFFIKCNCNEQTMKLLWFEGQWAKKHCKMQKMSIGLRF